MKIVLENYAEQVNAQSFHANTRTITRMKEAPDLGNSSFVNPVNTGTRTDAKEAPDAYLLQRNLSL